MPKLDANEIMDITDNLANKAYIFRDQDYFKLNEKIVNDITALL